MSAPLLGVELLFYSVALYSLRWFNTQYAVNMSIYYPPLHLFFETLNGLYKLYYDGITSNNVFNMSCKIVGLLLASILAIFIEFSTVYYIPVMFGFSGLFLIVQTMTIINLSFDITMALVEKNLFIIVSICVLIYSGILSYCIYQLVIAFNPFLIYHLVLLLIVTIISINKHIQERIPCSGLLSSGIIGIQATFFLVGTISSGVLNETALIIVLIFNILSLIKSIVQHATAWEHPAGYHVIIVLSFYYLASVVTNWNNAAGLYDVKLSEIGFWMKIGSSWFTFFLYTWCLLAPILFSNRDFGYSSSILK